MEQLFLFLHIFKTPPIFYEQLTGNVEVNFSNSFRTKSCSDRYINQIRSHS